MNNLETHHAAALPSYLLYGFHIKHPSESKLKQASFSWPFPFYDNHYINFSISKIGPRSFLFRKLSESCGIARPESPYGSNDVCFRPFPISPIS